MSEARARLEEAEAEKLMSSEAVTREAVRAAEQDGIVFIDEVGAWNGTERNGAALGRDRVPRQWAEGSRCVCVEGG